MGLFISLAKVRLSTGFPEYESGRGDTTLRADLRHRPTTATPECRVKHGDIRIAFFEACSGFTRVTARRIAQPPKAAFVTRLRPGQLPGQTARQLPDQSTILWVDPPSLVIRAVEAHGQ